MIYLDNAATTPVPAAVADAMYEVLTQHFGNPSSQYPAGQEMKKAAVNKSRSCIHRPCRDQGAVDAPGSTCMHMPPDRSHQR